MYARFLKLLGPRRAPSRVHALATVFTAALACMLALMACFLWLSRLRAEEAAEVATRNLVEIIESRVSAEFRLVDGLLAHATQDLREVAAEAPEYALSSSAWTHSMEALVNAFPAVTRLNIFNADGTLIYSTQGDAVFSIADRPHFQRLRDNPSLQVDFSGLQTMYSTGRRSIAQVRALRDENGQFQGVVSAVLDLDGLTKVFSEIDVGPGGLTLMRSTRDSRLILRVPQFNEADFDRGLPPENPIRQRVDAGARSGSLPYTAHTDGVKRLASFKRLERHPFYVQVALAESEYLAGWYRQAEISAVLALLAIATFGLITLRLARAESRTDRMLWQLKTSEQRLREAQSVAQLGSWEYEHASRRLQWSDEMFRILGIFDVKLGADLDKLLLRVHPEDVAKVRQSLDDRRLGRDHCTDLEYRLRMPTGRIRHVHETWETHFNNEGDPIRCVGTLQDITVRKELEELIEKDRQSLRALGQRLQHVLTATEEGIYDWHIPQDRVDHNERWGQILGLSDVPPSHPVSFFADLVHPEDREAVMARVREALGSPSPMHSEHRMLRADGQIVWVLDRGRVVERAPDGTPLRMVGSICDITARKESEARLALAASVFGSAREAIVITDASSRIIDVNEAFTRLTGYSRSEVIGRDPNFMRSGRQSQEFFDALWADLLSRGFWEGELWSLHQSGDERAQMATITAVRDAQQRISHYVALFADVTQAKENERLLRHFAHFDALTGLPNRVLLADRLEHAMASAIRTRRPLALAYVDLDGFKAINDSHGHEAGDHVLLAVAERMKECLRGCDTIARLGGDEFVAVLAELGVQTDVLPVVERMLRTISQPVHFQGHELRVSGSIGITFFPQPATMDADQLLRQADQAMYQAKLAGKNRHHIFDLHQQADLQGRYEQVEGIRQGLARQEFELYYQPKVHMRSGRVLGAEVLLRWRHPQRGLLSPHEFLPMVALHPVEIDLGWWVLRTALAQLDAWRAQGLDLPLSVNVTGYHLQQPSFVAGLGQLMEEFAQLPANSLELEVLESSALHDMEQARGVMESCRRMGVGVALDDFGTGYSTLTHLRRLPAQVLKIDRSFVKNMLCDCGDLTILEGILGLAEAFQRGLVAEGVESVEHGKMLLQLGCEVGQGFVIARPMPAGDVTDWLRNWRPPAVWTQTRALPAQLKPVLYARVRLQGWMQALRNGETVQDLQTVCPSNADGESAWFQGLMALESDQRLREPLRELHRLQERLLEAARAHARQCQGDAMAAPSLTLPAELESLFAASEALLLHLLDDARRPQEPEAAAQAARESDLTAV